MKQCYITTDDENLITGLKVYLQKYCEMHNIQIELTILEEENVDLRKVIDQIRQSRHKSPLN